ncbi:MAG: hypothetical protein OEY14_14920, partial [Myxococcales bacterium]|nr:hypothetical protein [Myxococcales bacterium]
MRRASLLSGALLLLSLFGGGLIGCGFFDGGDAPTRDAGPPGSVGDPCATASGCRVGLACTDGTCQPLGTLIEGAACELALDCAPGLSCGAQRVCTAEGSAAEGEACAHGGDCQRGLTCVLEGFFAFCRPAGGEDINAPCTEPIECLAGLSCDQGACVAPDALPDGAVRPLPLPAWTGAECQVDEGPATAYFQIPTGDPAVDADFYTLPFPNDLRRTGGRLDLSGHPTAGSDVDPNAFARYLEEAGTSLNGFSTNPVAFFRFSAPYDWDTVAGSVRIVDVDPDSPDFGRDQALSWLTTSGSLSNYICPDWLAIRTGHGSPLRFGTTYAVIVTTAVQPTAAVGGTFQRSPDLDALLGATRPAAEPHASAWDAYAPLRDFIAADTALTEATVLNATVFTTQDYTAMMPAGRDAVRAAGLPPITDLVQCDAGVTSPCDDGSPSRACAAADGSYIELHGRIELPIFQMGTPPYRTPAEGGAVILSVDGQPGIERREPVCFALTIPTSAMPAEGWPVLLHGHGTGGSFRSGIEDGLASDLASATTPAALLGFDLPQHGERRAGDPTPPELLVYNFENPAAANGNMIQGAMDLFTVVSFLEAGIIDAATSPTG